MAVRVTLECGHASVLRERITPEGYTHNWEVFVRGVDNADVHQYIDKVVFHLHETFPKPKRVLKEPPYVVKESGYAGFVIPIHVYLRNKEDPKKFIILYDLQLQPSGPAITNVVRHSEVISNPSNEFKRKLLKGGAVAVPSSEGAPDKGEAKTAPPMVGKPKLSGSEGKKHRPPEPRTSNSFADLFGTPIKTAKVSPDNKKVAPPDKGVNPKPAASTEKIEKPEKLSKIKHSPHKDGKRDKSGEDKKEKKDKDHSKERDRSKEKSKRPPSPVGKGSHPSPVNKRASSPPAVKKPPSPPPPPPSKRPPSPKPREKESKKPSHEREKDRDKDKEKEKSKLSLDGSKSEKKKEKKKHKEDREKEKKEKHKERDREKSKESAKSVEKVVKTDVKINSEKTEKDKIPETKVQKEIKKSPKPSKEVEKPKDEKPVKIEKPEKVDRPEKTKDGKGEKPKHKHKKRDKKDRTDGIKEKDKKEKRERSKAANEKQNCAIVPPPANPLSTLLAEITDRESDSAQSPDDDSLPEAKPSSTIKKESESSPPPATKPSRPVSPPPPEMKKEKSERSKKEKSKSSRAEEKERKRKRRSGSKGGEDEPLVKRDKERIRSPSPPLEPVSSSQSPVAMETEAVHPSKDKEDEGEAEEENAKGDDAEGEQVAPDSTNNALAEAEVGDPPVFSEDYVSQLKDLQQKIMTLQDNQELQRVVQVIAETGQYEITKKTFDFDLCALDRRTVQRLQQFFSAS